MLFTSTFTRGALPIASLALLSPARAFAQDTSTARPPMTGMRAGDMHGMTMNTPDPLGISMDRMGSGTTWVPDAAPIPSLYYSAPGRWDITSHGFVFAQYDKQGGPRGGSVRERWARV